MLGLGDQVGRDKRRRRRLVGNDDHFARPGDRVDADVAEDMLLGQRDEQVARPDDLVDLHQSVRRQGSTPYASAATAWAPPMR